MAHAKVQGSHMMAASSSTVSETSPGCQTCQEIESDSGCQCSLFISSEDFVKEATGDPSLSKKKRKKLKQEKLNHFLMFANALLNEGWGFIVIHTQEPHLLGFFDEAINTQMLSMISDDTYFHENFYRYYHDKSHVVFQIVRKHRPLSTLQFNMKFSTDTGLVDPSHGQVNRYAKTFSEEGKSQPDQQSKGKPKLSYIFRLQGEIEATNDETGNPVVFQESSDTQAKQFSKKLLKRRQEPDWIRQLSDYCFNKISLQNYISAFSLLDSGGSVFLGVIEEQEEVPQWQEEPTGYEELKALTEKLAGPNKRFTLYKDADVEDLYHIAETDFQVPTKQKNTTGKFECQGTVMTPEEMQDFQQLIKEKVKAEMLFITPTGDDATIAQADKITVHPFELQGGQDRLLVLEIRIAGFHGFCYTDSKGPVAYEVKQTVHKKSNELINKCGCKNCQ